MKSLIRIVVLFFMLAPFTFAAVQLPLIKETQKEQIKQLPSSSYETRKNTILKIIEEVYRNLTIIETEIRNDSDISKIQKTELLKIIATLETIIIDYEKALNSATNADELRKANQELIKILKNNKEAMKTSIATIIMDGIEELLSLAKEALTIAEDVSEALSLCKSDTSNLNELIAEGNKQLAELENFYNDITLDKKVTLDEAYKVKEAVKLSLQLNKTISLIIEESLTLAETCPAVAPYL